MLVSILVENKFRKRLQSDFDNYVKKSKHLSLRSFAKKLNLAPSTLHQYLSGKYFPSAKNLKKIGKILDWDSKDIELFFNEYIDPNQMHKNTLIIDLSTDHTFPVSRMLFKVLALQELSPLNINFNDLLARLNLKTRDSKQLKTVLNELKSRDLIKWNGETLSFNKRLKFVVNNSPSGLFLDFQKESIDQLRSSLTEVPKDQRLIIISQLMISPEAVPELSKDLNKFTAKIRAKYGVTGHSGKIYQFIGAFIPFD